jgi:hypothetical protein
MDALRPATPADAEVIDALTKASIAAIFPTTYDARQTASAIIHVATVDRMLLADGTYFVIEEDGDLVACGGWSRRHRMYTGSDASEDDDRLLDPAKDPAHIRAMFVRGDRTRRGLGTVSWRPAWPPRGWRTSASSRSRQLCRASSCTVISVSGSLRKQPSRPRTGRCSNVSIWRCRSHRAELKIGCPNFPLPPWNWPFRRPPAREDVMAGRG